MISVKRKQKKSEHNEKNNLHYVLKKEGYEDRHIIDHRKISWSTYIDGFFNVPFGFVMIAANAGNPETSGAGWAMGLPMMASIPLDILTGSLNTYNQEIDTYLNLDFYTVTENMDDFAEETKNNIASNRYIFQKKSDVDNNVPKCSNTYPSRFALIIGNEDYSSFQSESNSEINVDFARNDASAFREYAINTLGIPELNIIFLLDGTTGQMNQAISKLCLIIKNAKSEAEVFVYYAGHGLPDEITKEPYIIPVDVSGRNVALAIKLEDIYSKLTEYPSKRVIVFLDACFSGGARNQGLIAVRGVKVKPKESTLSGNLITFTASSGEQSLFSLKNQEHGMFTYYLLKKLQETKGNITYRELSIYLKDNVTFQSILINNNEQIPQTNISNAIINEWREWKIND